MDRHRRPDAGNGHGPGDRSRRARLVPRGLGDDDGGDDAPVGPADGPPRRPHHAGRSGAHGTLAPITVFVAGFLGAWTAFGLVAFGLARLVRALEPGFLSWDDQGPIVAGSALAAAGLYQLAPLKRLCLRHCRSPLSFVVRHWRDGPVGAARMGTAHGTYCVGCCAGLMLILFALGVMSLLWMAIVAALVFAEKVVPAGDKLAPLIALALVGVGIWVAVDPGSFPGLVQPM